ncbi:uncharacterized protein [Palaemon carinicauda]|uniref:uncharacterized protein isoform X1 n=1 Tax=Palaemon carinicauda TaxID=392227 RepID=UPI0035B68464
MSGHSQETRSPWTPEVIQVSNSSSSSHFSRNLTPRRQEQKKPACKSNPRRVTTLYRMSTLETPDNEASLRPEGTGSGLANYVLSLEETNRHKTKAAKSSSLLNIKRSKKLAEEQKRIRDLGDRIQERTEEVALNRRRIRSATRDMKLIVERAVKEGGGGDPQISTLKRLMEDIDV